MYTFHYLFAVICSSSTASDILITLWLRLLKLWFVAHTGMRQTASHKSIKPS